MKIVVYDEKGQKYKFLSGALSDCFWTSKEEDAWEYTKDDYKKVLDDFRNKKMNSNYTTLGYK